MRLHRPENPLALCYHGVADVSDDVDPNRLVLSPRRFESQLRWVKRCGYEFATAAELGDHPELDRRRAVITLDDGWADAVTTVLPLLQRLNVRASFYVCPGMWGGQHPDVKGDAGRLMTAEDAARLHDAGMEVGSHSMTHPDLRRLTDDELDDELRRSKTEIENVTGAPCCTFAYPFGLYGEREMNAVAAAGYDLAWAWQPGPFRAFAAPRLPAPPRNGSLKLGLKMIGIRRRIALA